MQFKYKDETTIPETIVRMVINFALDCIVGCESVLFRKALKAGATETVLSEEHDKRFTDRTIKYLNQVYRDLIKGEDEKLLVIFRQVSSTLGHSEACALQRVALIIDAIISKVDRSKLDRTDMQTYVMTLQDEMAEPAIKEMLEKLGEEMFEHLQDNSCEVPMITDMDPENSLFFDPNPISDSEEGEAKQEDEKATHEEEKQVEEKKESAEEKKEGSA